MQPLFKVDGIRHTHQALGVRWIAGENVYQPIRISYRQWLQQDGADDPEDGSGSGNAERQREKGRDCAARIPAPLA